MLSNTTVLEAMAELRALDDALYLAKERRMEFCRKLGDRRLKMNRGGTSQDVYRKITDEIEIAQTNLARAVDRNFAILRPALASCTENII